MQKNQNMLIKNISNQGIFFYYNGPISQTTVKDIISVLKQKLSLEHASGTIVRQVFPMIVENAQNIMHYSAEISPDADSKNNIRVGRIAVGYKDNHYFVQCGNKINNDKVETLREKLTKLQNMSKDEFKKYYTKQSRKGWDDSSKGAGLGFLEIIKNTSKPIEFDFEKIDENMSFFTLRTVA